MTKIPIQENDIVYATGVYLRRSGDTWVLCSFEDITYFDGLIVEDPDGTPYVETDMSLSRAIELEKHRYLKIPVIG